MEERPTAILTLLIRDLRVSREPFPKCSFQSSRAVAVDQAHLAMLTQERVVEELVQT